MPSRAARSGTPEHEYVGLISRAFRRSDDGGLQSFAPARNISIGGESRSEPIAVYRSATTTCAPGVAHTPRDHSPPPRSRSGWRSPIRITVTHGRVATERAIRSAAIAGARQDIGAWASRRSRRIPYAGQPAHCTRNLKEFRAGWLWCQYAIDARFRIIEIGRRGDSSLLRNGDDVCEGTRTGRAFGAPCVWHGTCYEIRASSGPPRLDGERVR